MFEIISIYMIDINEFGKVEIRVGLVVEAENVEKSEKLIRLTVDFGDEKRTIFTGVRGYGYTADDFADKKFLFVTNLEYRKIMGEESQGMILAVDSEDKPLFISAEGLPLGAKVR
jgi:methionyl-tRNA synthetase